MKLRLVGCIFCTLQTHCMAVFTMHQHQQRSGLDCYDAINQQIIITKALFKGLRPPCLRFLSWILCYLAQCFMYHQLPWLLMQLMNQLKLKWRRMFKWLKIFFQEFLKGELQRGQKLNISTSPNSSNPAKFLFKGWFDGLALVVDDRHLVSLAQHITRIPG